ncbi:MAG: hypothetical protein RLZZ316_100 [Bacteroidota bacterium]|jgi:hypothetical protein
MYKKAAARCVAAFLLGNQPQRYIQQPLRRTLQLW